MVKRALFVVDDDEDTLHQMQRDLEHKYGKKYRVLSASSGGEAVKKLRQLRDNNEQLAVIIANLTLPDMTGVEFLEQANTIFPNARRALLTTYRDTEAAVQAIERSRIDDYLVKPCHPPEQNLYPVLNELLTDWEICTGPPILRVVGSRFSPQSHQIRDFLVRNCVPFRWLDVERDDEARRLLGNAAVETSRLPLVWFPDGSQLTQPTNAEIAKKIGLKVRPEGAFYDLVIVGGGPSGLAAAVYGASEGLRTVMVERHAPGGQAGLSSMIENYLGFPAGLSGADLARRAVAQAKKFKVEIVTPQVVTGLRAEGSSRTVTLSDASELGCHVALLATGVQWRRLDVPGIDKLIGAGVYYGGSLAEAFFCRGEDIYIVGGANAAGQAAVYFARYARTVRMLVRDESLS
ncbi:MAG: fused response regulator/thioredoxin-disulfide reductase, partial [Cyanobacteria bacterium 13_1_40CM_2_61_4]